MNGVSFSSIEYVVGYGFVSFESFEASDLAIECMNGQYLCNRPIVVQYAFKKDTQGERHGSQAERMLAASQVGTRARMSMQIDSLGRNELHENIFSFTLFNLQFSFLFPQPQRFKPHTIFSGGTGDSMLNMSTTLNGMQTNMQYQQLQQQQQLQMQLGAYGAMGYSQMPMSMQMPAGMMPTAPSTLPSYMQAPLPPGMSMQPPPPPPSYGGYGVDTSAYGNMMPPPPPPPVGATSYMPLPPGMGGATAPPPPPPPPM